MANGRLYVEVSAGQRRAFPHVAQPKASGTNRERVSARRNDALRPHCPVTSRFATATALTTRSSKKFFGEVRMFSTSLLPHDGAA
jgi:hypothetical protein